MPDLERYSVHFRVSGPDLDVDALLARARPNGAHEVWRRGELIGDEGHVARTSGVQIEIVDAADEADVVDAVTAFLEDEAAFLTAVAGAAHDEAPAVLACALWVLDDDPVTLTLPPALLERVASAGVAVEIVSCLIEDDE